MDKIKSSTNIYTIVLYLVHTLYTFIHILYNLWVYLRRRIVNCCHEVFSKEYQCIDSKFRGLTKVPQHLAVILGPEEPSYKDLVKIVVWCTTSGIPYVSFYDHKGKNDALISMTIKGNLSSSYTFRTINNYVQKYY